MILRILKDWLHRSNKLERIWLLAKIEFKLRYYENKLGLLWALVKPLSDLGIYYVAFQIIMKQDVPHFVSFLFLGLILWNFFVECTIGTIQLLSTKKYLYEYTNMNKLEIYFSTIASNLIGLSFNFVVFILCFSLFEEGVYISWHILFILPILVNLIILALGFSLILSNLYIVAKDIQQIWSIVLGVGFWISPILFKLDSFRKALPGVDYINPISGIVINARNVVMFNQLPEWDLFAWSLIFAFFFLLLGLYLLNKLGSKAAETL